MAKNNTVFVCAECGATSPRWLGRCPSCGKFNTMAEEAVKSDKPEKSNRAVYSQARAQKLSAVTFERYDRTPSGISEFDTVLGGGIGIGSAYTPPLQTVHAYVMIPSSSHVAGLVSTPVSG